MFFSKFNAMGLLDGLSWVMALVGFFLGSSIGEPLGWPVWIPLLFAAAFYAVTIPLKNFCRKRAMEKAGIEPDKFIGQVTRLTENVYNRNNMGAVELYGKRWQVRSLSSTLLPMGTYVRITHVDGKYLIVEPIDQRKER